MIGDRENQFRPILDEDPPAFLDRVNTPWEHAPDLEEYNQQAYRRIVRALKELGSVDVDFGFVVGSFVVSLPSE